MPPPWAWGMRLLSCERDVPLARLTPSRLRLVPATPQLSYGHAFSPVTQKLRDSQRVQPTSRLSCVPAFWPAMPMLRDCWLARATSPPFCGRAFSRVRRMLQLQGWHWTAKLGFVPQPGKRQPK